MGDTVLVVFVSGFLVAMFMIWRAGDHDMDRGGMPSQDGYFWGRQSRTDGSLTENPYKLTEKPKQHEHWKAGYERGRESGMQDLYSLALGLAAGLLEDKSGLVARNPFDHLHGIVDVQHLAYFDREEAKRQWEFARKQCRAQDYLKARELGMRSRMMAIVYFEQEKANPYDSVDAPREHELWQAGRNAIDEVSQKVSNAFECGVFWGQVHALLGRKRTNPYTSPLLAKGREAWQNGYDRCSIEPLAPTA